MLKNAVNKNASRRELIFDHRAIATITAPPTMATTSRAMPAVGTAALPVCKPGLAVLVAVPVCVAAGGVITVTEVRVVRLPSARVLVLFQVEVVKLVCEVWSLEVVLLLEEDELELVVVARVEGPLVVERELVVSLVVGCEVDCSAVVRELVVLGAVVGAVVGSVGFSVVLEVVGSAEVVGAEVVGSVVGTEVSDLVVGALVGAVVGAVVGAIVGSVGSDVVPGTGAGSELVVEFPCRLASLIKLAIVGSSSLRASAA